VSADHVLDADLEAATGRPAADLRREQSAALLLARVAARAEAVGVRVETNLLVGDVVPAVLAAARQWAADLIVVGKSARPASGEPYVGSQTRHVLEFAEQPVLVIPAPA
jgi:nucleotide-binding universal stress UspA family protein